MNQVIGRNPLDSLGTPTYGFSVLQRNKSAKRAGKNGSTKLNLVSLMDIFTILVFFLMLNSGDVEVLQPDEQIDLPGSTATLKPSNAPVIKITQDEIIFRDQTVLLVKQLQPGDSIPALEAALRVHASENQQQASTGLKEESGETGKSANAISIMSDAETSYALLKRVLYASAQAGYRNIGLATEYTNANASTVTSKNPNT